MTAINRATIAFLSAEIERLAAYRDRLVREDEALAASGCEEDETWVEAGDAAVRFNVPKDRIRRWAREGAGKHRGGRWLVSVERIKERVDG